MQGMSERTNRISKPTFQSGVSTPKLLILWISAVSSLSIHTYSYCTCYSNGFSVEQLGQILLNSRNNDVSCLLIYSTGYYYTV